MRDWTTGTCFIQKIYAPSSSLSKEEEGAYIFCFSSLSKEEEGAYIFCSSSLSKEEEASLSKEEEGAYIFWMKQVPVDWTSIWYHIYYWNLQFLNNYIIINTNVLLPRS